MQRPDVAASEVRWLCQHTIARVCLSICLEFLHMREFRDRVTSLDKAQLLLNLQDAEQWH